MSGVGVGTGGRRWEMGSGGHFSDLERSYTFSHMTARMSTYIHTPPSFVNRNLRLVPNHANFYNHVHQTGLDISFPSTRSLLS